MKFRRVGEFEMKKLIVGLLVLLTTEFACGAVKAKAQTHGDVKAKTPVCSAAKTRTKAPAFCGKMLPVKASEELQKEMDRYGMTAHQYTDGTNTFSFLLYVPKKGGAGKLPLLAYIPGSGEKGELIRQFRYQDVFARITDPKFQRKHPCCLMAITPPESAGTLMGGRPGKPNAYQRLIHDMIFETIKCVGKIDSTRLYLTGFSYGGGAVTALALNYPGTFAAVVPIAGLPPLPENFTPEHPGNWWHFYNEEDYARLDMPLKPFLAFRDRTIAAGGDSRFSGFPSEGHDAWTRAWAEDEVWEWLFTKTNRRPSRSRASMRPGASSVTDLARAKCTASIEGKDRGCGPERALDGLDSTAYAPARAFSSSDWWMVELVDPAKGRVTVYSGDAAGNGRLKRGLVEVSSNGRTWIRAGNFTAGNGTCTFMRSSKFKFLRIRSSDRELQPFVLRRLEISAS